MKNKKSILPASFVLAILVLTSCKGLNDVEITGAGGFAFRNMENNKVTFAADIGVKNPSSLGFKVNEMQLKTIVDGNFIGTLSADNIVKIPAHSDSSYRMDFSLELANMLTGASTLYGLTRKKQVTIQLQGYIKAKSWMTTKKVDISETRVVDVPSFNR
jgi:LEA14-like dessication related protein